MCLRPFLNSAFKCDPPREEAAPSTQDEDTPRSAQATTSDSLRIPFTVVLCRMALGPYWESKQVRAISKCSNRLPFCLFRTVCYDTSLLPHPVRGVLAIVFKLWKGTLV